MSDENVLTEVEEFLKNKAKESGDPINFIYKVEEILYRLTEDFDWI